MSDEADAVVKHLLDLADQSDSAIAELRPSIKQHRPELAAQAEPRIANLERLVKDRRALLRQLRWTIKLHRQLKDMGHDPHDIEGYVHPLRKTTELQRWMDANHHRRFDTNIITGVRLKGQRKPIILREPIER